MSHHTPLSSRDHASGSLLRHSDAAQVSFAGLAAVVLFAAVCLGFHCLGSDRWVPVLDSANLALHEAGHPLLSLVGQRATVYGGTLFQIVFPLAAIWHFHRSAQVTGVAASVVWLGENLLNIARYMADARTQTLPLVGGGDHDWTEIFTRWHVLHLDGRIAGGTRLLGVLLIVGAVLWLAWRLRHVRTLRMAGKMDTE